MKGHSHIILGAAAGLAGYAVGLIHPVGWAHIAGCVVASIAGSLLPDLDSDESTLRQMTGTARSNGCLGRLVSGMVGVVTGGHRAATHTLTALLVVGLFAWKVEQPWALAFAVGYLAHIVADMLTHAGVPLFWPISDRRIHLLPGPLRVTTGSFIEYLVTIAVCIAVATFWI
jgi:inner membrane protein